MKNKLAIICAAALLAGTLFAAAQGTQPGGQRAEDPPQGANSGATPEGSVQGSGSMNRGGTVGSGQTQGKQKQMQGAQPGGIDPSKPPQGNESSSPNPK